jgi:hypothetical protein
MKIWFAPGITLLAWQLMTMTGTATAEIASRYNEPYPAAASKKGLQVQMVDDALVLGVKHAALNLNLTGLFVRDPAEDAVSYASEGETFRFRRKYLESMDAHVKALSDAGVLVNVIVLAYASGHPEVDRVVLHPNYDTNAPNHLGAFNTVTPEGQKWFAACLEFLAGRWSQPDRKHGRVVGYIIGNEVNSHWWWSNQGRATMPEFADDYLRTVRLMHDSIRKQSSWARVYLSLEHHWNIRYAAGDERQSFPGGSSWSISHDGRESRETSTGNSHFIRIQRICSSQIFGTTNLPPPTPTPRASRSRIWSCSRPS